MADHRYELSAAKDFPPVAMRRDIACVPKGNRKFYPGKGSGRVTYDSARKICGRCPEDARSECALWAIETGQAHGFWGGMTVQERSRHPLWRSKQGGDEL